MSISGNKVFNIICGIFVGSFILYLIYAIWFHFFIKDNLIKNHGNWTIGTVYRVEGGSKGGGFFLRYNYVIKEKKLKGRTVVLEKIKNKQDLKNKRFLVLFIDYNHNRSDIYCDYPVPDSIKTAPPEGWKKLPSWAKKKNDEE